MASIKQVYYGNPIMKLKLTLFQRFQNLKNYIDTELRGIVAAFPGETEHVTNEAISLASYIKDSLKYNGSSAVAQTALTARAANDGQDANSYAESAVTTANNLSDSRQPNDECIAENESVILNHSPVS